jgi:2-(1,2-epoxy-1,2-dihydrophenyl)acetyl-CoA isomerase
MAFESLRLEQDGGIARLTLIDAERCNPIDGRFCAEICEAAILLSERKGLRAVLIAAEGKAFSYGGDIATFVRQLDDLPAMIKRWTTDLHSAIARLQRMDAPIVAAVHGVCAGGMAAFVAGADYLIASDDARFVAAYMGIGYSCDAGSSVMFTRRMGLSRARRYLLLNETIAADEALRCGLADEIAPRADLAAAAEAVTARLAQAPTRAIGETRRLLLSAADQPLEVQLELEAQALARMSATRDAREGLGAFAEKRKPIFTGE